MESNFSIPLWLRLTSVTSRSINSSMTALKSRGEMGSPCRTP
ncbi:hypothetical protein T12_9153 [Trichinella patagoniensis]|uniref:Uncharacterized protein n=1 Tax=Trichinella patagoniensis TaxID=990121 RepID=A0A0V0XUQ4_9BILA|nr:hypothetical protein T12_9153 [Trichinella patagoniensis]